VTEGGMTGGGRARGGTLRIAFVTANTFEFDSRTLRAAEALADDGHEVVVLAQAADHLPDDDRTPGGVTIRRLRLERRIGAAFRPLPGPARSAIERVLGLPPGAVLPPPRGRGAVERLRAPLRRAAEILAYRRRIGPWTHAVLAAAPSADVYSAKALVALPVVRGAAARTGSRYVYDVADLHVESGRLAGLPGPVKAILARREQEMLREAAALTAVTPAMADELVRRHGVDRPTVVLNVRPRWRPAEPSPPASDRLSAAAGVSSGRPILLYQGAFRPDQGLEELLPALDEPILAALPFTAVFLGFGPLEERLRAVAGRHPGRVAVLPAVPSGELLEWTAGATLMFVGAPPRTLNQRLTTPNKLFESLMAGVPVLVAAGTATCELVREAQVGVCVDPWTPTAIAGAVAGQLGRAADERDAQRTRVRRVALDRYNWDVEREGLLQLYRRLAGESPRGPG
jgi:glycosyltransferase involved in cell wall biosynthesis